MGANILIVEDEEPLTTLLRYNLEAEGYEVDAVVADHHAHGARRGKRARAWPRYRRRRLYRQAVLSPGTAGARARAVAPRQSRTRRHRADDRRSRTRPREEARLARQPPDRFGPDRVSPPGISHGTAGTRVFPRATARWRLGQRCLYRRAHGRCACRTTAQGAQSRSRYRPDPHCARRRLFARRPLRQNSLKTSPEEKTAYRSGLRSRRRSEAG